MISFRFHLASLVAVFLSLGLGLLVGASLANDEGLLGEQSALIQGIEHSLNVLRAENALLQKELSSTGTVISFYDEVLVEAGQALLGTRMAGKRVSLVVDASSESTAQEIRRFLRGYGVEVQTIVWARPQTSGTSSETQAQAKGVADLAFGLSLAPILEPLIANGGLRFDGGLDPADSVILLVTATDSTTAQLAQAVLKNGYGVVAAVGGLSSDALKSIKATGADQVQFVDTLPGRLRLSTLLAQHFDSNGGDQ